MQKRNLSETVPAALRAELARRGITKGGFARRLGHDETWLYRRLTCRTEFTLSEVDQVCGELDMEPVELLAAAVTAAAKKTTAGRSTGRRSRTPNPHQ